MTKLDDFTLAYIEAALFTSTDDNDEPLDRSLTIEDIDAVSLVQITKDCNEFRAIPAVADDLGIANDIRGDYTDACAGHDFWLTRNGHGVGFWDRDLGACGDRLSDQARRFGVSDIYVNDGKIHVFPIG